MDDFLNDRWEVMIGRTATDPLAWHQVADYILDGIIEHDTLVRAADTTDWIPITNTRLTALFFENC